MAKDSNKPFFKRVWFWVLAIFVLICIGAMGSQQSKPQLAGANQATTPTTQTVFKVGDIIDFDNKKVTVISAERNWVSSNEFVTPQSGNEFVKVQVAIENNSNVDASYNILEWKLQDSNGVIKDAAIIALGADGALGSGKLAPGGKAAGYIVFEAPKGDSGLTLRYEPSFWSDKKVEIKL